MMSVRVFRAAFVICAVAVAYLAFAPLEAPPVLSWDKGNHVLAFFVMAWLADAGWPGRRREIPRWGLLLAYGLAIEAIQHVLPLRDFSWLDLLADGVGILLYLGGRRVLARVGYRPDLRRGQPIGSPLLRSPRESRQRGLGIVVVVEYPYDYDHDNDNESSLRLSSWSRLCRVELVGKRKRPGGRPGRRRRR